MKRDSSSDNGSSCGTSKISRSSKSSTSKSSIKYICLECSKEFANGQALGGHQNAHRIERTIRAQLPGILETILTKQPAATSSQDQLAPLAAVMGGGGVSHSPGTVVVNAAGFTETRDSFLPRRPTGYVKVNPRTRAINAIPPRYPPFGRCEDDNQLQTSDSERTETAPIDPVSRTTPVHEDEINSERNDGVDLELRLGFGG